MSFIAKRLSRPKRLLGRYYVSTPGTEKPPAYRGFLCGRYWDRTSDLFRVREARYRCANRPWVAYIFRSERVRWRRDSNPCRRLCRPLPRLSATPPCVGAARDAYETLTRADDEIRTRDPHLGKVMRYHCATSALLAFLRA